MKTRLVPPLTPEKALALHVACLQSTARLVASAPAAVDHWLYLTSPNQAAARGVARKLRLPPTLAVRSQRGNNLGKRLSAAFEELFGLSYRRVVVIGADSPTLPPRRLLQALAALNRFQAVLGPARDGGFYLIGLRRPAARLPELYQKIDWGTPRACRQMRARLLKTGRRLCVLPLGYDIDTAEDLKWLSRALARRPGAALAPLREWWAQQRGVAIRKPRR